MDSAEADRLQKQMSATDWLVDIVIFAGAFGFALLQLTLSVNLIVPDDFTRRLLGIRIVTPTAMAILATLASCLPLIVRRRFPCASFALCYGLWLIFEWGLSTSMLSLIAVLVSLFTLALTSGRNYTLIASIIAIAGVLAEPLIGVSSTLTSLLMLQNSALIAAVAFAGYSLHTSAKLAASAQAQADEEMKLRQSEALRANEALRAREAEASRRLEEERVRIAREVHDITGHSLSAVNVQASVAERLIDANPSAAKEALSNIRSVSAGALDELRQVVGMLRENDGADTQPLFGLGDMSQLVDYLESAGMDCELHEQISSDVHVSAYVGTALFGIAREAATNVVRHSGASKVCIRVVVKADYAEVSVSDDGCGIPDRADEGHGIEGMRERARALGGTFNISEGHEGGLSVCARIPLSQKVAS